MDTIVGDYFPFDEAEGGGVYWLSEYFSIAYC
jgi:hypothetical protein